MEILLKEGLKRVKVTLNKRGFFMTQGKAEDYFMEDMRDYVYRTRIYIEYKGIKISFLFHGSINDNHNNKKYCTKKEFPFMLYCFLSDSHSGCISFDNFCNEFGYDIDSRKAEKIYKLCIKSKNKCYKLGIQTENEISDLLNELNEKYDC